MGRIRPTLHGSQLRGSKMTLLEKIALAQAAGYPGIDFNLSDALKIDGGDPGVFNDILAKHGVAASSIGGVLGATLVASEEDWQAALPLVPERARQGVARGATRTGTVLWNRAELPKETLRPIVVRRLAEVDAALEGTGMRLGMEFLGVRTLHPERPYAFIHSMVEATELMDEAGVRNVGHTLDSYHWYAAGDTLDTIRQTPASRITLLHINDAKDVTREALIDSDRLVPGEGVIPLVDWLRAIDSTGFDGFVGMEVLGPRLDGVNEAACAKLGMDALNPLFTAAGVTSK